MRSFGMYWLGLLSIFPSRKSWLIDTEHRRAISWFKPTARQAIQKMWEFKVLLEDHGYHVNILETREPGVVIYEDEWQVVAKPAKGASF